MIDIAMLTCNRARIAEVSIREIKRRTTTTHRLLVLDNGSLEGSPLVLTRLFEEGLIDQLRLSKENNGVHWGFNRLLEMVESEQYVCTDGDLVPQSPVNGKDWLASLLELSGRNPEYAAISCRPHMMIGDDPNLFRNAPEVRERSHVGAALRLMRTELVRGIGGWKDVKRPSRNNEEWHVCGQLKAARYKVGCARDIRAIHLFGKPELGEDPWGYPGGVEHGHRPVSPPVNLFSWDRLGIDWETCR